MGEHIIKCRGLPWSTTPKDIVSFFHDCNIQGGESGVYLTRDKMGRMSGDCYVKFVSHGDAEKAKRHNKEHMGSRYVEIKDSERTEMEWHINRGMGGDGGGGDFEGGSGSEFVVKLRGLPFQATKKDITDFFAGFAIAPYGITISMGKDGRPSGEGFVEFSSQGDVERALSKNRETIGSRYIEIFKSTKQEIRFASENSSGDYGGGGRGGPSSRGAGRGRSGPYDRPGGSSSNHSAAIALGPSGFNTAGLVTRGGGSGGRGGGRGGDSQGPQPSKTGFMVHMRGLPFEATQGDVFKFFAPLNPVEVRLLFEDSGRAKGQCDVDFSSYADAESAMSKDKQNMGHRYIELFLRCDESAGQGRGRGGRWGNNSGPMLSQNHNNGPGFMNSNGGHGGPGGFGGDFGANGGGNGNNMGNMGNTGNSWGMGGGKGNFNNMGGGGGNFGNIGGGNFNNLGGGGGGGGCIGGGNLGNMGAGNFCNMGGGGGSGYSGPNNGFDGGNKQGFQMPQATGGNFY